MMHCMCITKHFNKDNLYIFCQDMILGENVRYSAYYL